MSAQRSRHPPFPRVQPRSSTGLPAPQMTTGVPTRTWSSPVRFDAQHVHRYASYGVSECTTHQNGRARGRMARIAVGIAARHDTDAHRRLGRIQAAVAHAVAARELAHCDDFAGERHHGLEIELSRIAIRERRTSVKHDAGTHPVGVGLPVAQRRGGVGKAARQRLTSRQHARRCRAATRHRARRPRSRNASSK